MKVHEVLKLHREQKHQSLQSVHEETRISLVYLDALENGRWEVFPAEVYLIGFMRRYCLYLGLDPEEINLLYKNEVEAKRSEEREKEKKEMDLRKQKDVRALLKGILLFILIIFIGVWWIYTVVKSHKSREKKVDLPSLKSKFIRSSLVQTELLSLNVKAIAPVWMRIVTDQALSFEGFLSSETVRSWNAKKEILVRIGNINNVQLSLNNRRIDPRLGAKKGVNEIVLTHQSLLNDSESVKQQNQDQKYFQESSSEIFTIDHKKTGAR